MYYTYVLYNQEKDKFYTGYTGDLRRRLQEHNLDKSLTDRRIKKLKLVYYEACLSKLDALERERQLKTGFGRGYLRRRLQHTIMPL